MKDGCMWNYYRHFTDISLLRLHYHYFCKARYASDDVYYTTIEDFYHKALTLYVPFITVS